MGTLRAPVAHFVAAGVMVVTLMAAASAMTNVAWASGSRSDTSQRSLPVRVELAAEGAVQSATALRDEVPNELRALVERAASRARYAPATVDGRPVPAALWVSAITRLDFDNNGNLTASVVDVVAGGVPSSAGVWPTPRVQGGAGYGAQVLLHAVFDKSGRTDPAASRVELLELWREDGKAIADEHRVPRGRPFLDAARDGLRRWRWEPDTVDGQPLRGEFAIMLTFASMRERMRSDFEAPQKRETTYRVLPPAGVQAPRLVAWTPARTPAAATVE